MPFIKLFYLFFFFSKKLGKLLLDLVKYLNKQYFDNLKNSGHPVNVIQNIIIIHFMTFSIFLFIHMNECFSKDIQKVYLITFYSLLSSVLSLPHMIGLFFYII